MLFTALANPKGSFIAACCWLELLPPGKPPDAPKSGVGAAPPDADVAPLLDCIPSKAANGSEAGAAAGFSGLLAKGSRTGFAEFVLDELFEPVKSPNASPPPPNASNALLPVVDAGDGAAKLSNAEGDAAFGAPNASNGEGLGLLGACAEGDAAVMSLNGSRDATELARLPARLVGVGASNALNGDAATGVAWLDAGASKPNGSSAFFGGLSPMRSLLAGGVLTLDEEKCDPGGGAILNESNFGTCGGGVAFGAGFCAVLADPEKSPKSAKPSLAFVAGLSKLLKSPKDCAVAAAVLLLPSKLEKSANPLSAAFLVVFELDEKKSSSLSAFFSFFLLLFDEVRSGSSSLA